MLNAIREWFTWKLLIGAGIGTLGGWQGTMWMYSADDTPPIFKVENATVHQVCFGAPEVERGSDRFLLFLPFDKPCRIKAEVTYATGPHAGPRGESVETFDCREEVASAWLLQGTLDLWRRVGPFQHPYKGGSLPFRTTTLRNVELQELIDLGVKSVKLEVFRADRTYVEGETGEIVEWRVQ